ncbi:hypothetical protein [Loktanella sp. SALINAS62]|uniref:hypothetical protein n=1 Tax=Loktanella sp. SALINAS62 TaxID=2706124 RepID=UPI001B8D3743|nr:hypothetical protein [Loktanella sp. SALINAS62]MBS1301539.1 hypothetical protein [Loktanella sp. SALINAS62]
MSATEISPSEHELPTAKKCPPFLDILQTGFYLRSVGDIEVTDEGFQFETRQEIPDELSYLRSPMSFHDLAQLRGCTIDQFEGEVVKFHNYYTIKTAPGYSTMFTHPANDFSSPFNTISAIVDTDRYYHVPVQIPAIWRNTSFRGIVPTGTPIAQCYVIRRETFSLRVAEMSYEEEEKLLEESKKNSLTDGLYRKMFRSKQR